MKKTILLAVASICLFHVSGCVKPGATDTPVEPSGEDQSGPLKFAFITDTHYGQSAAGNSDMLRLVEDMNSLEDLDFVLMGGDLTNIGSDAQISGAKAILDKLKVPFYIVAGNHDHKWSENGCSTFLKVFGYEKFEFEAKGYRFIGCASGPYQRMALGQVTNEHLQWLRSLQKGKPLIFLNHYPLDSGMSNWFEVRRELLRLGCRIVIGGHVHSNSKYNYNGLPGFTGRTALRGSEFPGYNIVTIENNQVSVAVRRLTDTGPETLKPWYETELKEVQETVHYDADGLPQNYPWMKYSDNASYPQVSVRWRVKEASDIWSGFAVDGETAWYTTMSGKVCALSLKDGSVKWTRQFDGRIWATPSVGEGALAFTCSNGSVYTVNAATGADMWDYAGASKVACPVIYNNAVYVGSGDGAFRAFKLSDGTLLWKRSGIAGFCDAAPYVDDGQVVTGSWGGTLYSMSPSAGTLQWTWGRKNSFMTTPGACMPIKVGNRIFVACPDRVTYCVDAKKGTDLYSVDAGRESLALSEDQSTLFIKNIEKYVHAVNVSDGSMLWQVESGLGKDIGSSALAVCGKQVIIPSDKGYLLVLDAATGAVKWRHKVGLGMVNPVSVWKEGDRICVLASSTDGRIELLEVTDFENQ